MPPVKTLSHDDYTVGWICALPLEMAAAKLMLDEVHTKLPQPRHDHNTYILGEIAGHNIAIACLPSGVFGTISAAVVAEQMLSTFYSIRFGVMVGIGGGVPSLSADIRLGDVVVSKPTGSLPGVVQYDYGKTIAEGHFQSTGTLSKPPQVLLTALSHLESNHMVGRSQFPAYLTDAMDYDENVRTTFSYPGQKQDQLFNAAYDHKGSAPDCFDCDRTQLVRRVLRPSTTPKVHYGVIASGNQVMKHGQTRDRLGKALGILCFEMEAAGLMDHFPCLVIRGICDYADSHKNKQWQGYAAAVAAAYAKELLLVVPINETGATPTARDALVNLKALIHSVEKPLVCLGGSIVQVQDTISAQERQKALLWLSTVNCRELHLSIYLGMIPGTCDWIFSKPEYQQWNQSTSSSILWLHGIPGSGKTNLTSTIVQRFLNPIQKPTSPAPVSYVYCSKTGSKSLMLTPVVILRTIIKQLSLAQSDDQIRQPTWEEYRQRQEIAKSDGLEPSKLTEEECIQLLLALTQDCPATIFIDGLDEVDGNSREVLKALRTVIDEASSIVKVFISSRDDAVIAERLQGELSICVSAADNSADIETFVHHKVNSVIVGGRLLGGKMSLSARQHLTKSLISGAREMFLWPAMQLEYLCDHRKFKVEADVLTAIQKLPPSLSSTFDALYARIDDYEDHAKQITKNTLAWLLAAERPLSVSELLTAVSSSHNLADTDAVPPSVRTGTLPDTVDVHQILDLCCNLIVLSPHSVGFSFAHASIREYLLQRPEHSISMNNAITTRRCLEQLMWDGGEGEDDSINGKSESEMGLDTQDDQRPNSAPPSNFHGYCTCYWAQHYRNIINQTLKLNIEKLVKRFVVEDDGVCFTQWLLDVDELIESNDLEQSLWTRLSATRNVAGSPVFMVCVYGLLEILQFLHAKASDTGGNPDFMIKNADGASPLYIATRFGHADTVQYIVDRGGDPNSSGGFYGNPLQAAAFQGFGNIVRILINSQADAFAPGRFDSAMDAAIAGGNESVISLLLTYPGVIQSCDLEDLLKKAAYGGHFEVVCDLLNHLALKNQSQVNHGRVSNKRHDTLQIALFRGRVRIASGLLKGLLNINEKGGHFGNALQAAAFGGHVKMVKLILDHGANIHITGRYGSALRAAALRGHDSVVRLLIDSGANIEGPDADALEAAAFNDRLSTVKTVLDYDLYEPHHYTYLVGPAVRAACFRGHREVAAFFLERFGSDAAHHALRAALDGGQELTAQIALAYYPDREDEKSFPPPSRLRARSSVPGRQIWWGPLHGGNNDSDYIPTVIPRKINNHFGSKITPDEQFQPSMHFTWRMAASEEQQTPESIRQTLGPTKRSEVKRKTLLTAAVEGGFLHTVRVLLDRGFDVNARSRSHSHRPSQLSPIEQAVVSGHVHILEFLLDRGGMLGPRALHYAVTYNDEELVRLLLCKRPDIEIDVSFRAKWSTQLAINLEASPLAVAVQTNLPHIVKLIVDHGKKLSKSWIGFGLLAASRMKNFDALHCILDGFELQDVPLDGNLSAEYFALLQAMREAAANRDMAVLHVLLQHVGSLSMRQAMLRDFIRDAILDVHWYGVLQVVGDQVKQLDSDGLTGVALLALAEKREDLWLPDFSQKLQERDVWTNRPNIRCRWNKRALGALNVKVEQEEETNLLKQVSQRAQLSEELRSLYGTALRNASDAGNIRMMRFILHEISTDTPEYQNSITNSTGTTGETAIYYTCKNGHAAGFDALVRAGANAFTRHLIITSRDFSETESCNLAASQEVSLLRIAFDALLACDHKAWEIPLRETWGPIISYYLRMGMDVDLRHSGLAKSLQMASYQGDLEYVHQLLDKDIPVTMEASGKSGRYHFGTPLHAATAGGQTIIVASLLARGVNVDLKADWGSQKEQTAIQRALLTWDCQELNERPADSVLETCEYLVRGGADDADRELLLNTALNHQILGLAKRLLQIGIRPRKLPKENSLQIMELLEDFGYDFIPLNYSAALMQRDAIGWGNLPLLEYLVNKQGLQISPNHGDVIETLLHPRARRGFQPILRYLIEQCGLKIDTIFERDRRSNYTDGNLSSLLGMACGIASMELARPLLEEGASVDCPGFPITALLKVLKGAQFGTTRGIVSVVELLLKHGANADGRTTGNKSPDKELAANFQASSLLYAVLSGGGEVLSVIQLLIDYGADVNRGTVSPLHVALRREHFKAEADLLVEHGAVDMGSQSYSIGELKRIVFG